MERPLIVGVDGSESSLRALDWAVDEAARRSVALRVVHGSRWEWYEGHQPSFELHRGSVRQYTEHIVAQAAERAGQRSAEVKVETLVVPEDPAAALIEAGRDASAVVVGSRGRGALTGLLLGSVSLPVAAYAETPVVVVRGTGTHPTAGFGQITVGVGEAPQAPAALEFALHEAELRSAEVFAVRTWRCPAHEGVDYPTADSTAHQVRAETELEAALDVPRTAHPSIHVRAHAHEGHPRDVLLEASALSDLLVVGARRRDGRVGLQLGPVNHAVLHHSACPVAIVPHG
ncbi:universal stress protein [Streptomyces sp. NPDC052225]|uniref:universal stress protein n=1 Tax=Streptomyces sp. NPDC052225 TaxID=3154949 RepID=UPI003440398A